MDNQWTFFSHAGFKLIDFFKKINNRTRIGRNPMIWPGQKLVMVNNTRFGFIVDNFLQIHCGGLRSHDIVDDRRCPTLVVSADYDAALLSSQGAVTTAAFSSNVVSTIPFSSPIVFFCDWICDFLTVYAYGTMGLPDSQRPLFFKSSLNNNYHCIPDHQFGMCIPSQDFCQRVPELCLDVLCPEQFRVDGL
ncbi:hypothetical protein T4A_4710 [Trichinella pseudospiralis]|uniref:Uncharacterized protein n=1 Tax=Trichinella pseudospiralis TaxID=6337 RepID=A0A0V1DYU6_TRIPS|nr:hypothetical protein T4A_4710 [Trichinella pseudospiralis]